MAHPASFTPEQNERVRLLVRTLIQKHGSQAKAAAALGVTQGALSSFLLRKSGCSYNLMVRACEESGVSPAAYLSVVATAPAAGHNRSLREMPNDALLALMNDCRAEIERRRDELAAALNMTPASPLLRAIPGSLYQPVRADWWKVEAGQGAAAVGGTEPVAPETQEPQPR